MEIAVNEPEAQLSILQMMVVRNVHLHAAVNVTADIMTNAISGIN
jgi:hypothetical protein